MARRSRSDLRQEFENAEFKFKYKDVEIWLEESKVKVGNVGNRETWSFYLNGRKFSVSSLANAKNAIDNGLVNGGKVKTRFEPVRVIKKERTYKGGGFYEESFEKGLVTRIEDNTNNYYGTQYCQFKNEKGEFSKVETEKCLIDSEENLVKLNRQKELDGLISEMTARHEQELAPLTEEKERNNPESVGEFVRKRDKMANVLAGKEEL